MHFPTTQLSLSILTCSIVSIPLFAADVVDSKDIESDLLVIEEDATDNLQTEEDLKKRKAPFLVNYRTEYGDPGIRQILGQQGLQNQGINNLQVTSSSSATTITLATPPPSASVPTAAVTAPPVATVPTTSLPSVTPQRSTFSSGLTSGLQQGLSTLP